MKETKIFKLYGMNCASCVSHIEQHLNEAEGVEEATVNFANEKAQVVFDGDVLSIDEIIKLVKVAGYDADVIEDKKKVTTDHSEHRHEQGHDHSEHAKAESNKEATSKLYKVIVGGFFSALIIVFMLIPPFQFKALLMAGSALIVILYTGKEYYLRGIPALLKGRPQMDTLVALGVSAAFLYSIYNIFIASQHEEYFMDAAFIATFIMLGRYLEAKAKGRASEAIKKLLELSAKVAHKVRKDGKVTDIPIDQVVNGDLLRVKPGEKIPVDGTITNGEAVIDESMVTGESIPVDKKEEDSIIGATVNGNTPFTMKAEKVGKETVLAQIIQLVEQAQMSKAPIQKLVDVISNYFVWGVIAIAIVTCVMWIMLTGDITRTIVTTVTVLVVACPCALGLATPISIVVGSGRGARLGILIKKADSLEKMHKITTICFDKTGTITKGKPVVTDFELYDVPENSNDDFIIDSVSPKNIEAYREKIIQLAASVEHDSEHPLGRAVTDYAKKYDIELGKAHKIKAETGKGITGEIQNNEIVIGNSKLLESKKIIRCAELDKKAEELSKHGKTVLFISISGKQRGLFALQDTAKESSKLAIELLHGMGIKTLMMTGDSEAVAQAVAEKVGIDKVLAKASPTDKTAKIKELQAEGAYVTMVGDGINDAPALAQANVGIAMGTGTDIAIESGDIVLVKGDLLKAVEAIQLSKATLSNIKQNLFWAFGYNAVGIPVAALGFLNPIISATAMAFSSISVVLNALRLKRIRLSK